MNSRVPQVSNLRPGSRFTLGQRIVLALVPRIVWALLRFSASGTNACCPARSTSAARATILISRSFDGELITRILELFGFHAVRGSSSRGAREGLLGLKQVIESGKPAIFTADGPRGPIYQTKMGPIKLAQITGAPIGAFHLEPEHAWVHALLGSLPDSQAIHAHLRELGAMDARSLRSFRRSVRSETPRAQRRHRTRPLRAYSPLQEGAP
jgi:hypothetical protein